MEVMEAVAAVAAVAAEVAAEVEVVLGRLREQGPTPELDQD
ncbi:hypothetical protein GCM10007315_35360 [Gemmobacter tilapiae]|uniref:Uncharacterized protein n=1 Tax=Neogemmobacter tilapiae TaxID=875041 RepID=A0A918WQ93_9RHOB|nr:hypothetical protein GCM10007315_35360 [Gemmobacter tilapiae]